MAFYRRTYHVIGFITLAAGLLLIPFMRFFTREVEDVSYINVIYLLFLANTVLSYFFAYKRTLLSAHQNNHINTICDDSFALLKYILQIAVILIWKSYIGFLVINLVCAVMSNVVISCICDRKYGYINKYRKDRLKPDEAALLKKSIVSLIYQKIGAKLVTGTDNLMISYAGIALMGVYSNYSMIINTVSRITYTVSQSLLGSIGNLMVQNDSKHKYKVFEEIVFSVFCFYYIISVGLSAAMERFISLWAGDDWLLPASVTFAVIMNFFLTGMRQPNILVIEAAGLFNRLRKKAVLEVIVNLVVSLVFLIILKLGIYGVLFGTTVSMVSVCIWWESLAVHKYAFNMSVKHYALEYIKYLSVSAIGCFSAYFLGKSIPLNGIAGLFVSSAVALMIAIVSILIFYGRSEQFRNMISRFIKRSDNI